MAGFTWIMNNRLIIPMWNLWWLKP
jgi:hypothetical protein